MIADQNRLDYCGWEIRGSIQVEVAMRTYIAIWSMNTLSWRTLHETRRECIYKRGLWWRFHTVKCRRQISQHARLMKNVELFPDFAWAPVYLPTTPFDCYSEMCATEFCQSRFDISIVVWLILSLRLWRCSMYGMSCMCVHARCMCVHTQCMFAHISQVVELRIFWASLQITLD